MKFKVFGFIFLSLLFVPVIHAETTYKSTADEQLSVEVTVYNNNLGLVKDTRSVQIPKGSNELRFIDVASRIMPVTVHARSVNDPLKFEVLEQNYEYDLINSSKLLDKFVGKQIKIVDWNQYQDRKETVDATLLANNDGPIFKIQDEIYLSYPGVKVVPSIPENLIAQPTLMWLVNNESEKTHELEVSYLTSDIGWKADYVLVLDKEDIQADLSGWVTIDNRSGAIYKNAQLKLVAGQVNRVQESFDLGMPMMKSRAMVGSAAPAFQEQAFFEYHIYDLNRKTTIKDNQTKQISLLEASGIKIQKELLVYGDQGYFTNQYPGEDVKQPVKVVVKFKNSKENNLGMPLPEGVMRFYKKDGKDSLQFVGEDRIDHTPLDEEVKLALGEAFDVVAERRQTDFKQLSKNLFESEWAITVRNHKESDVTVGLVEPLYGNWKIISNSQDYVKKDAHTIRFNVTIPKDGEVTVTYRVQAGI